MDIKYYNIYDILKIKTNLDAFPEFFKRGKLKNPDIEIIKENINYNYKKERSFYRPFIKFSGKGKRLYLEFKFNLLRFFLEDLDGSTKFHFDESPLYSPFRSLILPSWPNTNNLMAYLLQVKILQKKHAMIHAASFMKDGRGILLPTWPNTGKTTLCRELVNDGFNILGDEVSVLSENKIMYSMPYSVGAFGSEYREPFKLDWENRAKLDKVVFLRKGDPKIEHVEPNDIINSIIISTLYEFQNDFTRQTFLRYCFISNFDVGFVEKETRKILSKAFRGIECYNLYGDRNNYHKTIKKLI